MHWRVEEAMQRWGPRGLLLLSVGFVVALVASNPGARVPAFADADAVRIAALESARVAEVRVQPGDVVAAGDVLAVLDDVAVAGRIAVLQAELARQGAALADVERDARASLQSTKGELAEARSQLAAARGATGRAEQRLADARKQVELGLATRASLTKPEAELAAARAEASRWSARVSFLGAAAGQAEGTLQGDDAPALAAQSQAAAVVQQELASLERRRDALTLRAPVDARVAVVGYRVGEVLPAEAVIVELLPTETRAATACLPEQMAGVVTAGTGVRLEPSDGTEPRAGTVVEVIHQISRAPDRCQQRPNEFGWIRPVRIAVDGAGFVPGQRLRAVFLPPSESP